MQNSLKKRKIKDIILNIITYSFSGFSLVILASIIFFVFSNGFKGLSIKMIISDYYQTPYFGVCEANNKLFTFEDKDDIYYSNIWGIGLKDSYDFQGNPVIEIVYIDNLSPLKNIHDSESNPLSIKKGQIINRIQIVDDNGELLIYVSNIGAKKMCASLDEGRYLNEIYYSTMGGGIRGSLITTLYLILLTLLFALPVGIISAIYLSFYAKDNRFTRTLRTLIDMISGIPSIIFGLVAIIIIIPFTSSTSGGGNIMSGAITLAIMLLPTIIRTTEEAINTIPKSYTSASLALGASYAQTVFKVIIPNAIPGILTATLLSIGKIIGESAALILAIGTAISDSVSVNSQSSSLAVHIWTVMQGDNPNYTQACAISIVIIFVVLILNILVKLISKKLNRFEVK
ncbi:MAG: phosphate ABC transporter permease PstA [Anaeroplasma sp.]